MKKIIGTLKMLYKWIMARDFIKRVACFILGAVLMVIWYFLHPVAGIGKIADYVLLPLGFYFMAFAFSDGDGFSPDDWRARYRPG